MNCRLFSLLKSCRSPDILREGSGILYNLACWGETLELLYRIKFKQKEELESRAFYKLILPESICFDIGAGYGRLTYLMSKLAYKGKVYSFEPERYSFRIISKLVMISGLKNVISENIAMYNTDGIVTLIVPKDKRRKKMIPHLSYIDNGRYNSKDDVIMESVKTTTLDSYCINNHISKVDFIKCDVEGVELLVLQGAVESIKKFRPIIYVEIIESNFTKFGFVFDDFRLFFDNLDYSCFIFENDRLIKGTINSNNHNYFFIPNEKY